MLSSKAMMLSLNTVRLKDRSGNYDRKGAINILQDVSLAQYNIFELKLQIDNFMFF